MKEIGIKINRSVKVEEFRSIYKHKFTKETCEKIGSVHERCEIIYPLDNDVYMTVDTKEYVIKEGEMFIYAPNTYHVLTKPFNATAYIITFVPGYSGIEKFYNKVLKLDKSLQTYFVKTMEEMYESFYFSRENGVIQLKLNEGIPEIQKEITRVKFELFLLMLEKSIWNTKPFENKKISSELASVINNFDVNISANYSIYDIARLNTMSEWKLRKLFKDELDTTPMEYFNKMKIEYAKFYLLEGEKNITEISEKLGFSSIHYFSKFFKKHTGICPTDYIKAIDNTL